MKRRERSARQVILAPHPDDELIGCFDVVRRPWPVDVLFVKPVDNERFVRAYQFTEVRSDYRVFQVEGTETPLFDLIWGLSDPSEKVTIHAPDPTFETHYQHRMVAAAVERLMRDSPEFRQKARVVWYSTNMMAPYCYGVRNPVYKREMMEQTYPDQISLWQYDHRYFLFEGHCEWRLDLCDD